MKERKFMGVFKGKRRTVFVCQLPGCTDNNYARGLCLAHYRRWEKYGPEFDKGPKYKHNDHLKTNYKCSKKDCNREHYALGMCQQHYNDHRNRTPVMDGEDGIKCSVPSCHGRHVAKGYCQTHYAANWIASKSLFFSSKNAKKDV